MDFYIKLIIRLLLSAVLGGIIGYEREHTRRPAGFRTNIIVCVSSALVMLTSEYLSVHYLGTSSPDPARLGASVLSGIGFLGAGTIIRVGVNVKGLTTAASLWAVSCVGLAVGIGFYEGAVVGSLIIFLTLILLKKVELNVAAKFRTIRVDSKDVPGRLGEICDLFEKSSATIKNVNITNSAADESITLKLSIKTGHNYNHENVISAIDKLEGVRKVFEEEE